MFYTFSADFLFMFHISSLSVLYMFYILWLFFLHVLYICSVYCSTSFSIFCVSMYCLYTVYLGSICFPLYVIFVVLYMFCTCSISCCICVVCIFYMFPTCFSLCFLYILDASRIPASLCRASGRRLTSFWVILSHFGADVGSSWGDFGAILKRPRAILGHFETILGHLETILEAIDQKTRRRGFPSLHLSSRNASERRRCLNNSRWFNDYCFPALESL